MPYLATGVFLLGFLFLLAQAYTRLDPRSILRSIRFSTGGLLILFGLLLAVAGRWSIGVILLAAGVSAIATGRIGPFDLGGGVRKPASQQSSVRTDWFDMRLDHDTGGMRGKVLKGEFAGRPLDSLDAGELKRLAADLGSGNDSSALLEAYLDRRFPGWREDVEGDGAARARRAPDAGPMADKEAYEILGLLPGATEAEIRAAHHRLMKAVHPDQGGSTFLAAKINQAKDRLLGTHH